MNMYRYPTLIMSLILLAVGLGCQSPQNSKKDSISQTLRINIQDEPQTLDPRKARSLSGQTLVRMLFEGLTRVDKEEKAELALAASVAISSDLKTYTFHLKDSTWTNGDPVLASDFVYAWKKILSPDFPSDIAFHLYVIKNGKAAKEGKVSIDQIGVKILGDKTLEVELDNPTPYFLELVASPAFFPINQKVDEQNSSWSQNASTYVGNGPFQLIEWKHQNHLTLVKNNKYWDAPTVKISSLDFQMLQEETELKCFEKQKIDWAGSPLSTLPVDALDFLRKENKLNTKELLGTYFIRVNTEAPPFNHPSMRKAFALAINRGAIVDHVTRGNQIPATGLVPISLKLQEHPYFQDGDLIKAGRLFEEALKAQQLTRENLPEISLLYPTAERNHLIAQAIQQQWFEAFGIRVKLQSVEGKVYFDRVSKQDFQLSSGSWIADFADPINFLEVFKFKKGGSNNTLWENSRYAELLDQSSQVADPLQRLELLAQSEQILIDEMPMIPIFYYTMLYVNQPNLKGVVLSSMGQIDFKWAYFEKTEKLIAQGEKR
jgi:oligopeptide transport system substrate-binding protein